MARDYQKFKALLEEQETFPLDYTFKFIGRNTPAFKQGVKEFEEKHPGLTLHVSRISSGGAHLALTYKVIAQTADVIIMISDSIGEIQDVMVIL
ncbi:MAG: DUF493 domain-containing protein [Methylotenera sp.]|nr:DUF493 domain-containing protein [Oligoflexia bacterium]